MSTFTRRHFLTISAGTIASLPCVLDAASLVRTPRVNVTGLCQGKGTYFTWHAMRDGAFAAVDLSLGGNSLILHDSGHSLLIDTKFPALGAALVREGSALGDGDAAPVTTIINTHHHGDHTSGNAATHPGATIIAHKRASERISKQFDRYLKMTKNAPDMVDTDRDGAEQVLEEARKANDNADNLTAADFVPDQSIDTWPHVMHFGETAIVLHAVGPGHTDNDLFVQLNQHNIIHAGDLCFHKLHPFFDPDGGASCKGWITSLEYMIPLCDDETIVVPGHGELTDKQGLIDQKHYLEALYDHVAKEVHKGTPKDEVAAMSWDFMDGLGFEQIKSRAIEACYDEVTKE